MPLTQLYQAIDDVQRQHAMSCDKADGCDASCCHRIDKNGEPSVTRAEVALIDDFLADLGRFRFYEASRHACKFLSTNGQCRIYSVRPIDCRVHFCHGPQMTSQSNATVEQLVDDYHSAHEADYLDSELLDNHRFRYE